MICLGIETSGKNARVALTEGGRIVACCVSVENKTHSETLLGLISEATTQARIPLSEVGLIAVGIGPGAWTGLRMGVTTAKSLSYALSMPLMGVSTFETVGAGVAGFAGRIAVLLDARRGEICGRLFEVDGRGDLREDGAVFLSTPEGLPAVVPDGCALVGGGAALVTEEFRLGRVVLSEAFWEADAAVLCRRAQARFELKGQDDPAGVAPIYVRKSDAEINLEKKEGTGENNY